MKKTALFLSVCLLALIGAAQPVSSTSDPDAKKILDNVSAKFKSYKSVQAVFTLKVEDGTGKVQGNKKGTVSMKGARYRVSITGQEIYCDGKTVWTYDKSANEVTVTQLDESTSSVTPQKLFTNFYDKDFLYKYNGEKKQGGKTLQEVELTPTDKTKNFHKVYILVDKKNRNIYSTRILEKGGNVYSYTITSLKGNVPVKDDMFVFDKKTYPGVEVVDLR